MPEPWWLISAGAIVAGMAAAIGKLWSDNVTLRREASERTERIEFDHKRDLRRVIWGSSKNPPKE